MTGYWQLTPEFVVLAGGLLALAWDRLPGRGSGAALIGAVLALGAGIAAAVWGADSGSLFGGALVFDPASHVVRMATPLLAAVWLLWLSGRGIPGERSGEAVSAALLSTFGAMLLCGAADLVTFFMALEITAMPGYLLLGYRRHDTRGLEGALKYFLLSLLSSLVMLYGFSFLFGVSGSTAYADLVPESAGVLALVGFALALVGLFAKLTASPFHFWAPDAYAGASAGTVSFVSTVPKIAATLALVRFVGAVGPDLPASTVVWLIGVPAALSMVWGNLAALTQTDARRLMAYSGVAHAGYILIGVTAFSADGFAAAVLYSIAYAVPSMAVLFIVAEEGPRIEDLGKLVTRRPVAAWSLVVLLLSLVGIPPLAGFIGKLTLFRAGLAQDLWPLVVIAVSMSVVSAAYYLRIIRSAFFGDEPEESSALKPSPVAAAALAACVVATAALGIAAGPLLAALGIS